MSIHQKLIDLVDTHSRRFEPPEGILRQQEFDQQALARMIGLVAFGLPVVMFLGGRYLEQVCFHISISHFYYSPFFGTVFVAMMSMVTAILLAYRGLVAAEWRLATFTALCAAGVALFPTSDAGCMTEAFTARPFTQVSLQDGGPSFGAGRFNLAHGTENVHNISSALLIFMLFYHACFVFTRRKPDQHGPYRSPLHHANKRRRNTVYRVFGCLIAVFGGVLAVGIWSNWDETESWKLRRITFWLESGALWSFGLCWMLKGRLFPFGRFLFDEQSAN